jgi:hypothetical protein
MNLHMMRAISSPSRSTTGLATSIFAISVIPIYETCVQDLRRVGAIGIKAATIPARIRGGNVRLRHRLAAGVGGFTRGRAK